MIRYLIDPKLSALHRAALVSLLTVAAAPAAADGITYDPVETGSATTRTWNSGKDGL